MKNFPYICCNFCRDCSTSMMATKAVQWSIGGGGRGGGRGEGEGGRGEI